MLMCYIAAMRGVAQQQLELDPTPPEPPSPARSSHDGHVRRPSATRLLETPGALLTRSDLRQLGLERRAVDAVFRQLSVVSLPGYSRPMVYAHDYLEFLAANTYRDDRVRPIGSTAHG